ncbi:uncharacterized protein LOC115620802 [Scaptodrosophila lebanonensis]|uniref:Uncharacterized protein LOC115620802 n=1 Tax=Drosophila lebanonensis TaxID=7225 RepID=A0A6J2SZP9_DROLE|nr:uncharacterized protein LOC115620802 [Scaptodrosophila lebanonensis]
MDCNMPNFTSAWTFFEKMCTQNVKCLLCSDNQIPNTESELLAHLVTVHNINTLQMQMPKNSEVTTTAPMDQELDPYSDTAGLNIENYLTMEELEQLDLPGQIQNNDNVPSAEMELIKSISYFRDKASFYRKQKNITAQHALKIKKYLDTYK